MLDCLRIQVLFQYMHGATTLAYLYMQLGYAARGGVKQIAGYFPPLEVLSFFNADLKNLL